MAGIPGHRGAGGRPPKVPSQRQGHGAKPALTLIVPGRPEVGRAIPKPPKGLLAGTRRAWRNYWGSVVGQAADPFIDGPRLERYFGLMDDWLRVLPKAREEPFLEDARGNLKVSPYVTYRMQLEERMERAEAEFGMTPSARARLGMEIGKAKLTADEVARRLDAGRKQAHGSEPAPESGEDAWEAEWTEA